MRYVFIALVSAATVFGTLFIDNPHEEAFRIQGIALEALGQAKTYVGENPKQLTGSALTMFASTIIWFVVLRVIRNSKNHIEVFTPKKTDDSTQEFTNPIVEKIRNRQLVERLEQERHILIGRSKWLPDQIRDAEKEVNAREAEEIAAELELSTAELRTEKARKRLNELLSEQHSQTADLFNIDIELSRLKDPTNGLI
jgi:hypothetical protein